MNMAPHQRIAALLALFLTVPAAAQAQDLGRALPVLPSELSFALHQDPVPDHPPSGADGWRAELYAWMWMIGLDGDVGARGLTTDVSASFCDILDASDSIFAFSGRLEVGKGRWGAFVDGLYAKLGADNQSGPLGIASVDVTFEQTIVDFGLMYRLGEWEAAGAAAQNRRNTTLDLYGGGRYTRIELDLDPATLPGRSDSQDWLDPIVGAKLVLPLSQHWHTMINGDVGGFGVESKFTWSATAVLGYDFTLFRQNASLYAGYRAIGWDFSEGSGDNEFTWDIVQHGPIIGFSVAF